MDSGDISKESSPAASPAARKIPLEELSKEELLKKYKGVILIAQKAKLAKDETADEIIKKNLLISTLEEKLQASEHEIKKEGHLMQKLQEQLQATQELLASQQKLHSETEAMVEERVADLTASIKTENSELLKELNIMNQVLKQRGELISKMTASHADYTRQIDELEVSLSNTTKELHLKTAELENMADFTRQLAELKLTLSTMSKDMLEKDKQIEALSASQKETELINEELKQKTALLDELQSTHEGERSELLKELNERERRLSEIQEKMQTYQSQVMEVSSNHEKELQALKSELNSKNIELENCTGLQEKICDLQKQLKDVIVEKDDALVGLKEELASLKNQIEENGTLEKAQDKNEALVDQISALQSQLETYKIQCADLMEELQSRNTDMEQFQKLKVALAEKEVELRLMQENLLKEAEEKLCLSQAKSELESQHLALEDTVLSEKKISSELKRLCSEKDQLIQELQVAKDEVSSDQADTINFNSDRIRSLEDQLFNLNQTVEIKDKTIEDLQINLQQNSERMEAYRAQTTMELDQLNETKGRNEDLLSDLNHQLKLSEERINDKDLKISDLVKSLDLLNLQLEEVQMQLNEKDGIIKTYEVEVSKLKSELSCLNESVSNDKNVLINDELKEKDGIIKSKDMCISNLTDENEKIRSEVLDLQNVLTETKSTLSNNSIRYEELKSELSAKVEELETEISKQRDEITKLNTDQQQMTDEQLNTLASLKDLEVQKDTIQAKYEATAERENDLMKQLTVLQETLQAKEASLQQLEQELSKLKEGAPHEMAYTEISSTYSMSHAEEQARLRDLEDSFEDKYTKLRVVAVKLKRRVSELTQTLESERNKMSSEKSELQAKLAQLANHAKTTQTLQSEVDRLQDMLEEQRKCQQQLSRDLDTAVQDATAAKSQLESMQEQLHEITQERNSLQTSKDNLAAALSHAEALSSETDRLCKEIREKELLLEHSTEEKRKLSEQLEKACADAKKKSVLSLEIEDMEKSVFELTQQLNTEKTLSRSISCELDQERVLTSSLREQLQTLEEVAQERQQSIAVLDEKLLRAKMEVEEYKDKYTAQDMLCKQLQAQLEAQQSVVEGLNLQCADLAARQVQLSETARQQIEALGRQVYQLEEQCSALRDSNGVTEAELAALRSEFEGYKVRAQSVLRQSNRQEERSVATRAVHDAEELELEVERLRVTLNNLKATHQKTITQLESALQEANIEREEKARALKACQSLRETSSLATERQHSAEEKLSAALEEARQAKLHAEMLMQCYKQQIEDLKTAHSKKVTNLTEQLENLQATINNLNASEIDKSPSLRSGPSPVAEWASSTATSSHPDPELHRMSSLTREEGEGSESVDSFPSRRISVTIQERRHELVPLDKLLSSSSYPEDEGSVAAELASSTQLNIDTLQSKLNACEARASHLTALLSEAESDAARLSQLNTVLKEEIRRQQRSEERTQHAHNLEYLKNIVVKFITLQNGDERQRLIPVLNTILKLSPEEAAMIASVAKGTPQSTAGARGWGSYLPIPGWSGS